MSRVRTRRARSRLAACLRSLDLYLVLLGLLVFMQAVVLGCQTSAEALMAAEPRAATAHGQFAARVDMVQVTVTVLDGNRLVHGLPAGAFRVYEDDVARPLTYFAADNVPLDLIVAVDVSSSMRRTIGQMKENASRFVAALPSGNELTLVSFNDQFRVIADRTAPREDGVRAISPLAPFGMTALYDVMVRCFDVLGQSVGRRGMVMFTDGEDTSSRSTAGDVERRAESSDAVLYMMGHGQALKSPELKDLCERLAARSGGRAFFPRELGQLDEAFDSILEELSAQYLLVFQPRTRTPDGQWHRIRVDAGEGRYRVRARQGYRYMAATGQ